jgi:leader peptidase (prepilin peptidase)/N-methyltransferase
VTAGSEPVVLSPWLVLLCAPVAGSFLGVLVRRLPANRPVIWTRSVCDNCNTTLDARDLVPIASFLLLRGRCRTCGCDIAWFHFAVELAAIGVAFVACALEADPAMLWLDCILGWMMLALAWIDWEWLVLPDVLIFPVLLAGLVVALTWQPEALLDRVLAAAIGYSALGALALGYRLLRGREGVGPGDAKLLAAAGAWLGLAALPWVVLLAACAGLITALVLRLGGRPIDAGTALPFGPWLAMAIWIFWLLGDRSGVLT